MTVNISRRTVLILVTLSCCIGASFILHFLPYFQMDPASYGILKDPDVWYNYRQIEVMVSHFPQYNWFDPMTAYPFGKYIDWGPVFPFLASVLCLLTGASQRVDLIFISSWLPILISLVMIPVVFGITRIISGWKAGIIAAIFITVISGQYFYSSSFGVVDHHIAEVLFTSLFCFFFLYAIKDRDTFRIDFRRPDTLVPVALPSFLAGISMAAGLLVVPTVMFFVFILGIYSVLQFLWDIIQERSSEYLLLANGIIALCSLAGLVLVGVHSPVYSLATYSMAPVHAFIVLLGGTFLLYLYSLISRKKPLMFLGLVLLTAILGFGGAVALGGEMLPSALSTAQTFFGNTFGIFSIQELRPWSLAEAWADFNIGIILSIAGFVVLTIAMVKKKCEGHLFVLVWGTIVFFATIKYSRFEYFSAVIVAIFSAWALGAILIEEKTLAVRGREKPVSEVKKGKPGKKSDRASVWGKMNASFLQGKGIYIVFGCIIVFCGISLISDYSTATVWTRENLIPSQWIDTLEWVEQSTPNPDMSYFGPYSPDGWQYPPGSYGILSSWDYGHWITFLGKRIPITNPFQDNVKQAYAFFYAESEDTANGIAESLGARYVIVDWKMGDTKFQSTIPLYDSSLADHYYFDSYLISEQNGTSGPIPITLVNQPYYRTMISRLYNSDGSLSSPGKVIYIEYSPSSVAQPIAVISALQQIDSEKAHEQILLFNAANIHGKEAAIHGIQLNSPIEKVSALRHYRLVYEASGQDQGGTSNFSDSVKMFEYVKGARLKGEGIIEVSVETNLGRVFVYRQESENGYFILPYSTSTGLYPVHTLGPYRIAGSGRTIEVSEQDVIEGNTIG
jgi:oligosaccharyl transferase (archaeosortase A-associated)